MKNTNKVSRDGVIDQNILRVITVKEAADIFKVSQANIRKKCTDGVIPHFQEGEKSPIRFKASELYEYIESGRVKTTF